MILREKPKVDHQTWVAFYQWNFTAVHDQSSQPIKKDLMELLEFVPPVYHAFYWDLLSGGTEDSEDESEDEDSESDNSEQSDPEDSD